MTMSLSEQQVVPYGATELRGERLLILAPHPDDEVIGCGGLIAKHVAEKRQVRVVIATDGAAAADKPTSEDYRARRERESILGLQDLGAPAPVFLRFSDRNLEGSAADLRDRLRAELREFSPDLIAVPSPIEVHPDHLAMTRAFIDLMQSDADLAGDLAVARVAFYEVSQPIQPNALLDITAEAEAKYRAIGRHSSQTEIRDYEWFSRGLNQYRSMTLFPAAKYAEGYHVVEISKLRTEPWSRLAEDVGGRVQASVLAETVPISVIVRTRNRHRWLQQALASIRATGYPASVVVVNDGGASPREVVGDNVTVIDQAESVGRSEAMNIGVRSATTPFLAFLDDDDLYYPEHLSTLANAARSSSHTAFYSDAVSSFHEPAEDGSFREIARLRLFAQDFDPELLLFDNYIPLPTLLVSRDPFLAVGGFDREFDLLEDWDFLLRLSRKGPFLRIPRITCEIRHFRGGDSAILSSPEESPRFREAKLRIWSRHADRITPAVTANVFEKQKRRLLALYSDSVESKGQARHLERDVTRLDREKTLLLEELQNEHRLRNEAQIQLGERRAAAEHLERALNETREAFQTTAARAQELADEIIARDQVIGQKDELAASLFAEIQRLNELLDQIYRSRTWKLHQFLERIRGRR